MDASPRECPDRHRGDVALHEAAGRHGDEQVGELGPVLLRMEGPADVERHAAARGQQAGPSGPWPELEAQLADLAGGAGWEDLNHAYQGAPSSPRPPSPAARRDYRLRRHHLRRGEGGELAGLL